MYLSESSGSIEPAQPAPLHLDQNQNTSSHHCNQVEKKKESNQVYGQKKAKLPLSNWSVSTQSSKIAAHRQFCSCGWCASSQLVDTS